MSKHTPGPWKVVNGHFKPLEIRGKYSESIAEIYGGHHPPSQCGGNAKLIAASPDLLDALKAFLAEADSWHDSTHPEGEDSAGIRCDGICACRAAARAAIAKAEGRCDLFALIELRGRQKQLEADLAVLDGAAKEFMDMHSMVLAGAFALAARKLLAAWNSTHPEGNK